MLILVLAGCASRPGPEALLTVPAIPEATQATVYAATTRERDPERSNAFTTDRSPNLNYTRFTVSIPPGHEASRVTWPRGRPDPRVHLAVMDQSPLTKREFAREIADARARRGKQDVGIFVHGYNYNFQESLFRLVQMSADTEIDGIAIAFSWPSQASVGGYIADRDSAAYSRDHLAELVTDLARDENVGRITIIAHSLGGWLAVEALRQLRLQGRHGVIDRLNVILAAPDIDADVFRQQVEVIGPMSTPMTVLVSSDDRALRLSQRIASSRPRFGALDVQDPRVQETARRANIQVIDVSELSPSGAFRHDRYIAFARLLPRLQTGSEGSPGQEFRRAGVFVLDAVEATLFSPFDLVGRALAGERRAVPEPSGQYR